LHPPMPQDRFKLINYEPIMDLVGCRIHSTKYITDNVYLLSIKRFIREGQEGLIRQSPFEAGVNVVRDIAQKVPQKEGYPSIYKTAHALQEDVLIYQGNKQGSAKQHAINKVLHEKGSQIGQQIAKDIIIEKSVHA